MARQPRLFVSGGVYHVYCRTHRGERRFDSEVAASRFLEVVARVAGLHELTIFLPTFTSTRLWRGSSMTLPTTS